MVHTYAKGATAERELLHTLYDMGYMVLRAPHSGSINLASPDLIAAKHGKLLVIECKARKAAFSVPLEQLNELKEWRDKAGATAYVAWKISRKGWTFLHLDDVYANKGNIGKKFAEEKGIKISEI
jgi:Holliday junction resolvase